MASKRQPAVSGKWWCRLRFDNSPVTSDTADAVGDALLRENEASIAARYPSHRTAPAPAYRYLDNQCGDRYSPTLVTAVAALKLVICYEYQSCEHEGWDTSAAKRFCQSLRSSLVAALPGYDVAPWAIE
jgi:hypothetical protein